MPGTFSVCLAFPELTSHCLLLYRLSLGVLHIRIDSRLPVLAFAGAHLERYPTRIFLCAYMVQSHPQTVFNHQGELEDALTAAGSNMLGSFEALLARLAGPVSTPR